MTREQKLDALLRLFDKIVETVATDPMVKDLGYTHWMPSGPIAPSDNITLAECMFLGRPGTPGFNDEDWIELP